MKKGYWGLGFSSLPTTNKRVQYHAQVALVLGLMGHQRECGVLEIFIHNIPNSDFSRFVLSQYGLSGKGGLTNYTFLFHADIFCTGTDLNFK